MTEYLGEEWFDLVNAVTGEGEKLGPEHYVTTGAHWSDDYILINSFIYGITIEERK